MPGAVFKELHVLLDDNYTFTDVLHSYESVTKALKEEKELIYTTQLAILRTSLLESYRVFLHKNTKSIEVKLGACKGTDRNIQVGDNLEKLVLAGEFSFE